MHEMSEGPALEDKMEEFNKETDQLWDDLMGYELQLVDQLEDAIKVKIIHKTSLFQCNGLDPVNDLDFITGF